MCFNSKKKGQVIEYYNCNHPSQKTTPLKWVITKKKKLLQKIGHFAFNNWHNITHLCPSIKWWPFQNGSFRLCIIIVHKIECINPNETLCDSSIDLNQCHYWKLTFIFHKLNDLNTCYLKNLCEFWELVFLNSKRIKFGP